MAPDLPTLHDESSKDDRSPAGRAVLTQHAAAADYLSIIGNSVIALTFTSLLLLLCCCEDSKDANLIWISNFVFAWLKTHTVLMVTK